MLLLAPRDATRTHEAEFADRALMQRAGEAVWRTLLARWPDARHVVVVAGAGNNGGDGRVVAALAKASGKEVSLIDASGPATALPAADLVVDAVLGIGMVGAPRPEALAWIDAINDHPAPVLAIDVPSGVDAERGTVAARAVVADVTLELLDRHPGLYTGAALDHVGCRLYEPLVDHAAPVNAIACVAVEDARRALPTRAIDSHKGDYGDVWVVGGNHGMAGAGLIASVAALRSGAGRAIWATRAAHASHAWLACPELMTFDIDAVDKLRDSVLSEQAVLAVGPGLGTDAWSQAVFDFALDKCHAMVLDADALNLLAVSNRRLPERCVLTPHPGEAARLLGMTSRDVQADRYGAAGALASRFQAVCVLKGAGTVVAAPSGAIHVVAGGNPGMAVAGMGDALTGLIAGLLAQLKDPWVAAWTGAALHAGAGDALARTSGSRGLRATALIDLLPAVMKG